MKGWAFIEGESSKSSSIYIVLKSNGNTYVFDTTSVYKPSVTAYFETLNLDLDWSGFIAKIPKDKIVSGGYEIGIYIEKDGVQALQYTDKFVTK